MYLLAQRYNDELIPSGFVAVDFSWCRGKCNFRQHIFLVMLFIRACTSCIIGSFLA